MSELNVLLSSAGRRPYLARWFREALDINGIAGRVVVADIDRYAPARQFADVFIGASRVDDPRYSDWLRETIGEQEIGLALSVNDFELSLWSRLSRDDEAFDCLVRLDACRQEIVEDKLAMATTLTEAGLLVPDTVMGSGHMPNFRDGEIVIKGRFGSGSRGLLMVRVEDLAQALEFTKNHVADRTGARPSGGADGLDLVVVQSRVTGQEFGLDIITDFKGQFLTVLAREKIAMRGGETDKAMTVDPAPFMDVGRRLARLTGHRGIIDVDVVVTQLGEVMVLDVNPRFGGGYPFSHAAGAHIPAAYIAWAAGREAIPEYLLTQPGIIAAKYVEMTCLGNSQTIEEGDDRGKMREVPMRPSIRYALRNGYILRELATKDIPLRVEWFNDPYNRSQMTLPDQVTEESTRQWLVAIQNDPTRFDFAVEDMESRQTVAMLGLRGKVAAQLPELYILVHPDYRGRGIGKLALSMMLDWVRKEQNYQGVRLFVAPENDRAIRLYSGLGFRTVGEREDGRRLVMELAWGVEA